MTEATMERWFSLFIRLRDSDDNGYCQCITCTRIQFYKEMDCGHGIPRQYKATKYNEKNNNAQCAVCNSFEGGKSHVYKERLDKKFGVGTWDTLEVLSRTRAKKLSPVEINAIGNYYRTKVNGLLKQKHIAA